MRLFLPGEIGPQIRSTLIPRDERAFALWLVRPLVYQRRFGEPSNAAPAQRSSTKTCHNVSIPAFIVAFRRSITKETSRIDNWHNVYQSWLKDFDLDV